MIRCPYCQISNRNDSRFCASCGAPFTSSANAAAPIKSKNNTLTIGAIVIGILFSCGMCELIGKLSDNAKNSSNIETASVKNTTALSQTPIPAPSIEPPVKNESRSLISKPTDKSKTAFVITDDAGVFDAPKPDAYVLQKLSKETNIEVIRQKGVWFYVSIGGKKGWMHGNAIRYKSTVPDLKAETSFPPVETPKTVYSEKLESPKVSQKTTESEINNSGATAKCRDGSLSYSAHRRGTCSHHGGVAVWY